MAETSFLAKEELLDLGLKEIGENVLISRKASIYGASNITIENDVRIDDFCILSGRIHIGNNVHVAAYSALFGSNMGIYIQDFANISSRVCIYAISDDFSGRTMTNPTVPDKYKSLISEAVFLEKHVIVGTGCTILPGVTLREGTAIGAMSLCNRSTESWNIYAGIPIKKIGKREKTLLSLEVEYINERNISNKVINA